MKERDTKQTTNIATIATAGGDNKNKQKMKNARRNNEQKNTYKTNKT